MAELPRVQRVYDISVLEESVNTLAAIPTRQPRAIHVRNAPMVNVSKLPPAVAAVPADQIRCYAHTKRVNNYLVGNTLGEGSFARVKEGFHVLVGEKVSNAAMLSTLWLQPCLG